MLARSIAALLALVLGGCSSNAAAPDLLLDGASPDSPRRDAALPDVARREASRPDVFVPFSLELTVNRIPAPMNGSASFVNLAGKTESFRLTVPRHTFAVDVLWRGTAARPETLEVTASVDLGSGSAVLPAGTDLGSRFVRQGEQARWLVPQEAALPLGPVTLHARMNEGGSPRESSLTIDAAEKTFLLDPFRLDDVWLLVFSQDLYTITRAVGASGDLAITSTPQSNGLPDFEDDLRAIGFGTAQMLPAAAATQRFGATGTNAIVRTWVQREMLKTLRLVFGRNADGTANVDSVGIVFYLEGDPGAPSLAQYKLQVLQGGEGAKSFSAIAIGGGDPTRAYLGMSKTIDLRNVRNEDNLGPLYGVFTTKAIATLVDKLASDPAIKLLFQTIFGDFVPELGQGGKPVGEHPLDAQILAESFDPKTAPMDAATRYQRLSFLVETLGRLAGALTAHEIGHSLGLVANGPPPHGLFGGEKNASFVDSGRTTSGHIDTGGFDLMAAGPGSAPTAPINFAQYLGTPRFNELSLSYLQGRVLLLP
jgi:hypothetical protein